jgi:hypothetical protein
MLLLSPEMLTLQDNYRFFDVAKFSILTLLSLLSLCRFSFPTVRLKIPSPLSFALKFPNSIFNMVKVKVKQSLYRPGVAQGVPGS